MYHDQAHPVVAPRRTLPPSHALVPSCLHPGRHTEELFLYFGGCIGFWQGDVSKLVDDAAEFKPTMFCGVPRVYDRIYSRVMSGVKDAGGLKKVLFEWGYNRKLHFMKQGKKQVEVGACCCWAAVLAGSLVLWKCAWKLCGLVRSGSVSVLAELVGLLCMWLCMMASRKMPFALHHSVCPATVVCVCVRACACDPGAIAVVLRGGELMMASVHVPRHVSSLQDVAGTLSHYDCCLPWRSIAVGSTICHQPPRPFVAPQASPFFDKLVFSKVKARLGGRVRMLVSGGAPLAPHVEEFLKVAFCCPVVQVGYACADQPERGRGMWDADHAALLLHVAQADHLCAVCALVLATACSAWPCVHALCCMDTWPCFGTC